MWRVRPHHGQQNPPIILRRARASGAAATAHNNYELFQSFITTQMLDSIVTHTNEKILRLRGTRHESYESRMLTIIELEALISILYLSAARRDSNLPAEMIWSDQTGAALYRSAISANRFKFLLRHLRFTPVDTREDHFILFSQMWTWFIKQCQVNCEASMKQSWHSKAVSTSRIICQINLQSMVLNSTACATLIHHIL